MYMAGETFHWRNLIHTRTRRDVQYSQNSTVIGYISFNCTAFSWSFYSSRTTIVSSSFLLVFALSMFLNFYWQHSWCSRNNFLATWRVDTPSRWLANLNILTSSVQMITWKCWTQFHHLGEKIDFSTETEVHNFFIVCCSNKNFR